MQHSVKRQLNFNSLLWSSLLAQGIGRLPHAMLMAGPAGVGKAHFAEQLAALLLCEAVTAQTTACGKCDSCRWMEAGNHPDYRRVAPDDENDAEPAAEEKLTDKSRKRGSRIIRIEQIRELESFVFVGSHRNGNRVVLLADAEAMNPAAANSLLKILEEPPSTVYFILITSSRKSILPTIRSRCRVIHFTTPDAETAAGWLQQAGYAKQAKRYLGLAGGAPLQVAHWQDQGLLDPLSALIDSLFSPPADPCTLAAKWDALLKGNSLFRLENLVEEVQRWLFDLAQERMTGEIRYHAGWPRPKGLEQLHPQALLAAWRELLQFRRSARHPLNQLLFLESLAAHLLRALRPVGP